MIRYTLLCLSLIIAQPSLFSQPLYTPRNIQEAYKKGTRSPDGRPGPGYWQNKGRYAITINAAPPDRTIRGSEQIVYINNSPDTLRTPVIRLVLNIHQPGAVRNGASGPDYLTQGIQIDAFSENGQSRSFPDNGAPLTWRSIRLTKPLAPHDSIRLSFD